MCRIWRTLNAMTESSSVRLAASSALSAVSASRSSAALDRPSHQASSAKAIKMETTISTASRNAVFRELADNYGLRLRTNRPSSMLVTMISPLLKKG